MCFSLFFAFTPTTEFHPLLMIPCHIQAEGGTGPAGCSYGVLSRRKGRVLGPSRPGGVSCPSLLGQVFVTLSGVGSATCSVPGNQPPAPAGASLLHVSQLRPRPHSQVQVSKSCFISHPCPAPAQGMEFGLWAFPMCLAGGGRRLLGRLWGIPGASRVTVVFPW